MGLTTGPGGPLFFLGSGFAFIAFLPACAGELLSQFKLARKQDTTNERETHVYIVVTSCMHREVREREHVRGELILEPGPECRPWRPCRCWRCTDQPLTRGPREHRRDWLELADKARWGRTRLPASGALLSTIKFPHQPLAQADLQASAEPQFSTASPQVVFWANSRLSGLRTFTKPPTCTHPRHRFQDA